MFGRHRRKDKILFALSDVCLTLLAFELAYRTRLILPLERVFYIVSPVKLLLMGAASILWPAVGVWLQVYDRLDAEHFPVVIRETLKQCVFCGVAVVMVEYVLRLDLSRPFLGAFLLYAWILLTLFRVNAPRLVGWYRRGFGSPDHIFVAGLGPRARRLGRVLERSADYGVRLMGFFAVNGDRETSKVQLRGEYPVYPLTELQELLEQQIIDEIIFAVDSKRLADLEEVLLLCDEEGVLTRVAVDFFPHVNSEVYLDRLRNVPLLTFSAAPHDEVALMVKRLFDIVVSSTGLILFSPLLLVVALLVRMTSPGPVVFRQTRCGLNGRRFVFYKFRSMVADADQRKQELAHLNEKTIAFKIARDPRVTPLGRWLRKFSIDELPQLWNVLKGDMSLVGPRPPVPEEVAVYRRWQRRRMRMRPGLTCLWALEGRDRLDFDTWMRKDLEYIDNWSLSLDLQIILKTIPGVVLGRGAN